MWPFRPDEWTVQAAAVAALRAAGIQRVPTWRFARPGGRTYAPLFALGTFVDNTVDAVRLGTSLQWSTQYAVRGARTSWDTCSLSSARRSWVPPSWVEAMAERRRRDCDFIHEFRAPSSRVPMDATAVGSSRPRDERKCVASFPDRPDRSEARPHQQGSANTRRAFDANRPFRRLPDLLAIRPRSESFGPSVNVWPGSKQLYDPDNVSVRYPAPDLRRAMAASTARLASGPPLFHRFTTAKGGSIQMTTPKTAEGRLTPRSDHGKCCRSLRVSGQDPRCFGADLGAYSVA